MERQVPSPPRSPEVIAARTGVRALLPALRHFFWRTIRRVAAGGSVEMHRPTTTDKHRQTGNAQERDEPCLRAATTTTAA